MTLLLDAPTEAPPPRRPGDVPAPVARRAVFLVSVVVLLAVAALGPSLWASLDDLGYGAALAELGLLPFVALPLFVVAALRHPWTGQLRAGRPDVAVASGALLLAAAVLALSPVVLDNLSYAVRADLLALPLVLLAGTCLLLGVRAVVGLAVPLAVTLLAWPLPWRTALVPLVEPAQAATSALLLRVVEAAPWLATRVPGEGDLRLTVQGPREAFDVVLGAACGGSTGMTAVLVGGLLAQYVLHGPARARACWLLAALVGAFALNLLRLVLLLVSGRLAGEQVALDVVHPVAGLLLLNGLFGLLLLRAGRFGLTLSVHPPVRGGTPLTAPVPADQRVPGRTLLRRGLALVLAVAVLAGLDLSVPGTKGAYAGALPAATAFSQSPFGVDGFVVTGAVEQRWAQRYYGDASRWTRYRLRPLSPTTGYSLWLDAVATPDWGPLRAHPVVDCYRFHGYELLSVRRPVLTDGLLADEVVYRRDDGATWHVLSWTWAVRNGGADLSLERVSLLASSRHDALADAAVAPEPRGTRARLASVWGAATTGTDPAPGLSAALRATATSLVRSHLHEETP